MRSNAKPARDEKADAENPEKAKDRLINLDAKPEAITLNPVRTAVIVVDMQNDFGSKGGMFDRAGIDISGIQEAVGPTAKVLAAARGLGIKIIYLKMGYVQRLPLRLIGRLHERANRPWIATKQSRRLAPECRDGAGLDLGLRTISESRPLTAAA
jgi:hypothetical protein